MHELTHETEAAFSKEAARADDPSYTPTATL